MGYQLTYSTTTINLSAGLRWTDEYQWLGMASSQKRALDGTLVIEANALPSGRPITLEGGNDHGWISKATIDALRAQLTVPGRQFTLTINDGRVFNVIAMPGQVAIEARQLMPRGNPEGSDYYIPTIRLMQV